MVIIDFPYVSDYFQECLVKANIPVIHTPAAKKLNLRNELNLISESEAIDVFKSDPDTPLYTNSENAISWIGENLSFTDIPDKINLFKDKYRFRNLVKSLYPDYYFNEVYLKDIDKIDKENLPYPLIIKPAVGFFSLGVYKLNNIDDWDKVQTTIREEAAKGSDIYPGEVYNSSRFILEECIPGREFAIDAYFNNTGEAIIMNITEHFFSSSEDLGDRLYQCRPELFMELYDQFLMQLQKIGNLAQLRNFPIHIEVRQKPDQQIIPIEVNPMRFGGWCTTGDLASMSFGINPYEIFHKQLKPDWENIFSTRKGKAYNLILLDNVTGLNHDKIKGFDYSRLSSRFKNVLEIRKIDFSKYPIFGFLFVETDQTEEPVLDELLRSDLSEYVMRQA